MSKIPRYTLSDLKRSAVAGINKHIVRSAKLRSEKKPHPQKEWIEAELKEWCRKKGLSLETELVFAKPRKWRFDWAIPELMTAIEYEGIYSKKSRHTTQKGYTNDTEKYNQAAKLGWTVLRYTAGTYKNLITDLNPNHQSLYKK